MIIYKVKSIRSRINGSELLKSSIVTLLGSSISKLILVITTFVCTHLLTQAEFGEFSFIRNILNMILGICALNFVSLCTKFATEVRYSSRAIYNLLWVFVFSVSICVVACILIYTLPSSILLSVLSTSSIISYFKIVGFMLPLFMLQPLIEGVMRGMMKFKLIAILQIFSSLLFLVVVICGIRLDGVHGAILGMIGYYAIYSLLSLIFFWDKKKFANITFKKKDFWYERNILMRVVLPVFIASFVDAPVFWFIQVTLIKYGSMEDMGSMTAIMQIRNLIILFSSYFLSAFVPFVGQLNARKEYKKYFLKFDKMAKVNLLIGLSSLVVLSLLSKPILFLYGESYMKYWVSMVVSCLTIPLLLINGVYKIELIIQEKQKKLLVVTLSWNIVWALFFLILLNLNLESLTAFFVSQLFGMVFQSILIFYYYRKDKKTLLYEMQI